MLYRFIALNSLKGFGYLLLNLCILYNHLVAIKSVFGDDYLLISPLDSYRVPADRYCASSL